MQGRTYCSAGVKDEMADAIREFNQFVRQDSRVDVLALPFRDGVSIITRRCQLLPTCLSTDLDNTMTRTSAIWEPHVLIGIPLQGIDMATQLAREARNQLHPSCDAPCIMQ